MNLDDCKLGMRVRVVSQETSAFPMPLVDETGTIIELGTYCVAIECDNWRGDYFGPVWLLHYQIEPISEPLMHIQV